MTLIIDTSDSKFLKLGIKNSKFIKIPALFKQSEKLLPSLIKLLEKEKLSLADIKAIKVADSGDSFTALRIGLLTANALAYALNIPITSLNKQHKPLKIGKIRIVKAQYQSEPNIGKRKQLA